MSTDGSEPSERVQEIVETGTWMYQGVDPIVVDIWSVDSDIVYDALEYDDMLQPEDERAPMGPDGRRYHAHFRRPDQRPSSWPSTFTFETLDEAKSAAEDALTGPVIWGRTPDQIGSETREPA